MNQTAINISELPFITELSREEMCDGVHIMLSVCEIPKIELVFSRGKDIDLGQHRWSGIDIKESWCKYFIQFDTPEYLTINGDEVSISHKFEYATDEDYWEPMYNYCFYAHRCLFEIETEQIGCISITLNIEYNGSITNSGHCENRIPYFKTHKFIIEEKNCKE